MSTSAALLGRSSSTRYPDSNRISGEATSECDLGHIAMVTFPVSRQIRTDLGAVVMDADQGLRNFARVLALSAEQRAAALQRDLLELEKLAMDKRAALRVALLRQARLGSFLLQIAGHYQCPRCWIEHGIRSALKPIPNANRDIPFTCNNCGCEPTLSNNHRDGSSEKPERSYTRANVP